MSYLLCLRDTKMIMVLNAVGMKILPMMLKNGLTPQMMMKEEEKDYCV